MKQPFNYLRKPTSIPNFKKKYEFYVELAHAYSEWDRFLFNDAFTRLSRLDQNLIQQEGLEPLYTAHLKFLKVLIEYQNSKSLSSNNNFIYLTENDAIDLYCNTLRRMEEGKYDDALSRLYRLVEMLTQIEFCKIFSKGFHKSGSIDVSFFPENFPFEKNVDKSKNKYYQPSRSELFELLKYKDSARAEKYLELKNYFENLLKNCNQSRLAHGQQPIPKEVCDQLIDLIKNTFNLQEEIKFPKLV